MHPMDTLQLGAKHECRAQFQFYYFMAPANKISVNVVPAITSIKLLGNVMLSIYAIAGKGKNSEFRSTKTRSNLICLLIKTCMYWRI